MKENYRPAILCVMINDENKFLIGNSPRDGGFKMCQGGIDEGEISKEALIREIKEELGFTISENQIIKKLNNLIKYNFPENRTLYKKYIGQEFKSIFLVKINKKQNPIAQDNEFEKFYWITFNEFENYNYKHRKEAYKKALIEFELNN